MAILIRYEAEFYISSGGGGGGGGGEALPPKRLCE